MLPPALLLALWRTIMRIELAVGCPEFAASDANVHLDIYTPEATVEAITPMIQYGIDVGWIIVKDEPKAITEEVSEEVAGEEAEDAQPVTGIVRPTQKKQCIAKAKTGSRCKRNALKHSGFCISHISEEDLAKVDEQLAAEAADGEE